ncbi:MAG: hypothetical protein ABH851_08450, partial [Methanobacteriota archaeon]
MQPKKLALKAEFIRLIFFSLLLLPTLCSAQGPSDEPVAYEFSYIKFAMFYNGVNLSTVENMTKTYIEAKGAQQFTLFDNSTPVSSLEEYDVIIQIGNYLNTTQIDAIEDANGSLILIHEGITNINTTRWGIEHVYPPENISNVSFMIGADSGPTRGYPVNSTFSILKTSAVSFNVTGSHTQNLINVNNNLTVVASKQQQVGGKTILIGFNLTSYHEIRILDKAIYWIEDKSPTLYQNSRYCLYECLSPTVCRSCSDAVVVIENPSAVTPQENSSYYFIYIQHGDIVNKIEYSEFTLADLSETKLIVVPKENKITSQIPSLRSDNKSLMFVYQGVFEAWNDHFNGFASELVNKTNITNGDAIIVQNREYELTYGYPVSSHIYTQNESTRVLAEVPGFTTLVNTSDGSLLSYVNGSSKVVFYGFDPYASQSTQCMPMGYHGGVLYLRAVDWALGNLNVGLQQPNEITFIVYNNNVMGFYGCGNTLTISENSTANRLTGRYGSGNVSFIDLSRANATNYSATSVVISISSERVSSKISDWVSLNKSLLLLYEGAVDVNITLLGGSSENDSTSTGPGYIRGNIAGSISMGYPSNAYVHTQNDSVRYLTDTPGFSSIVNYGSKDLLQSRDLGNRIVVYGFDPYKADVNSTPYCLGYHGWKLFDRSVDWLLYSLNISAPQANRIAIQFYGANESWYCDTGQESKARRRISGKEYGGGNVSSIDLSVADLTDYSNTELIIIGDSWRVTSMISGWKDGKDLMFLMHATTDATNTFGGSSGIDLTNDTRVNLTSYAGSLGFITEGYSPTGIIESDFALGRTWADITGFEILGRNVDSKTILSSDHTLNSDTVVYTLNLTEYDNPCRGYHGWKLFDRSVEWLLGELTVPIPRIDRIGLVVNILYNETHQCLLDEEDVTFERIMSLENVSLAGINTTTFEISTVSTADFTNTEAVIITDSNIDAVGTYYENILNGYTKATAASNVLMFRTGMDRYRRDHNQTPCNNTMHYGSLYGRITTTNDQNRQGTRPPYGYPFNAKVQVHGGVMDACYWSSLPQDFFGFLKNDTESVTEWIGVGVPPASSMYIKKLAILGYRPYEAWMGSHDDTDNAYYHGSTIFDRVIVWLLGDPVVKDKTKDIVVMVYNKNNRLLSENVTLNWSIEAFNDERVSILDISDVMYYDTCGTSRFIPVKGDLVSGIVDHWSDQLRGIIFLGESLYDAAKGLSAFPEGKVDPLDDEYAFSIYGEVVNTSYPRIINLTLNSVWEITESSTGVYSIENMSFLNVNYTPLILHANRSSGDEVILTVSNTSNQTGIALFGINTLSTTDMGKNWTLNAIEWSNPLDAIAPNVTSIDIQPYSYSPGDEIIFNVKVIDNRNWSVYYSTLNYSKNNVNWTLANLTHRVDPDSYTCEPKPFMNDWNHSIGPFNESFIVYTISAVDTTGNKDTTRIRYYGVLD